MGRKDTPTGDRAIEGSSNDVLIAASRESHRMRLALERMNADAALVIVPERDCGSFRRSVTELDLGEESQSFRITGLDDDLPDDTEIDSLSTIGIAISKRLTDDGEGTVWVPLDDRSTFSAADPASLFSFLHLLRERVRSIGSRLICTIDSDRYEERELRTLAELFDDSQYGMSVRDPRAGATTRPAADG